MVIKASSSAEIRGLVEAIVTGGGVGREAAVARLVVIGPRAVDRLVAAGAGAPPAARRAILRALEPMADRRALSLARDTLRDQPELAPEAAAILRRLLTSAGTTAAAALDALMTAALDPSVAPETRQAAAEALGDVSPEVRSRLAAVAAPSAGRPVRPRTARGAESPLPAPDAWADALEGRLPPNPETLRPLVAARAAAAPLTALQRLVDLVRAREEAAAADRDAWTVLRGALHQALAQRGSRVALYDLRESFERAEAPLPVAFLAAVEAVGDASCLEPLAAAWARAGAADGWWRDHLAAAFRAIIAREKLTRRSAVLKKVLAKWPAVVGADGIW